MARRCRNSELGYNLSRGTSTSDVQNFSYSEWRNYEFSRFNLVYALIAKQRSDFCVAGKTSIVVLILCHLRISPHIAHKCRIFASVRVGLNVLEPKVSFDIIGFYDNFCLLIRSCGLFSDGCLSSKRTNILFDGIRNEQALVVGFYLQDGNIVLYAFLCAGGRCELR